MFNLIYVTWDEVNQSYTDDWAKLNGVVLTAERVLAEVREIPRAALVVDWDFCLDRGQFDALIAQFAGKTVLAVHGYTLDDGERQRLRPRASWSAATKPKLSPLSAALCPAQHNRPKRHEFLAIAIPMLRSCIVQSGRPAPVFPLPPAPSALQAQRIFDNGTL